MWKCPYCENEIDTLDYSVEVREWGYVNLSDDNGNCQTEDYESRDNEWNGDPEFSCPECSEIIEPSELTLVEENETEEKEEKEEEKKLEEEKFNIIKPEKELQLTNKGSNQIENTMICKHCFYVFAYSDKTHDHEKEEQIDCPSCGEPNNVEEYKALIETRYFEKLKVKKLKRHAKKTKSRRLKPLGRPRRPICLAV